MPTGTPRIMVADDSALVARVIERHSRSLGWVVAAVDDEKMTIRCLELGWGDDSAPIDGGQPNAEMRSTTRRAKRSESTDTPTRTLGDLPVT
jgi:CheY-like chemotaxis protein